MFDTVVATPLSPGTANSSPTANAPPRTNVMNPLRKLRRAFAASTCPDWGDWSELTLSAATPSNAVGPGISSSPSGRRMVARHQVNEPRRIAVIAAKGRSTNRAVRPKSPRSGEDSSPVSGPASGYAAYPMED
jgi:hypothetical protein